MRLFHNRPFAFLCLTFISVAFCLSYFSWQGKALFALLFFFAILVFAIVAFIINRRKGARSKAFYKTVFLLLVAVAAMLAPLSHLAFVDARREAALNRIGERYVSFVVVSEEYEGEFSSEYLVKTESIDKESASFKCLMICSFSDAFDVGDKIYAKAELYPVGEELFGYVRFASHGENLQGVIQNSTDYAVISEGNKTLSIHINTVREEFSNYLVKIFGEENAGLAEGFLLGEKSGLSSVELRDLRRSGTLHLLAVSGLHMSVIIGSFGMLLTKLRIPRGARSVILSIAALAFLALTGFSISACRSVVMLWIVYMSYLYVKENDAVTSLFSAVALIIFFVPTSVSDVGLWLSFLATLGVVSAWQPLANKLSKGNRSGFFGRLRYLFKKLMSAILITFICNAFICIVIWACFGEISTVSLLSNLVLSPMSSFYIILVLLCCIFSFFTPLVSFTAFLGKLMFAAAGYFSQMSGAVISLTYDFAPPIIILMSVAIAVMLVIRLRRKWLILMPPVIAVIAFCICFVSYTAIVGRQATVNYYSENKDEMLVFTNGYSASLCDISNGSYSFMRRAQDIMASEHATEIGDIMLTHYHSRHPATLERFFRTVLVRGVCIPYPEDSEELYLAKDIAALCEKYKVELTVYENGKEFQMNACDFVLLAREQKRDDAEHQALCVVFGNGGETLTYVSAEAHSGDISEIANELTGCSDNIIFGIHGRAVESRYSYDIGDQARCVFYSDPILFGYSDIEHGEYTLCVCNDKIRRFAIPLG